MLPVSALTNLTTVQLEVLLLHELAHIRRHDYLVNWIQCCFEVLFFYHPAFWWLSRQVRTAREYCCDDWVLRVTNEPLLYAQTLTQLQFNHFSIKTNLAMTAIKNQGVFTTRIHRLFGKYESQNSGRKGVLTAMLLVTALIAFVFYPSVANVEQTAPNTMTTVADTSKLPVIIMLLEDSIPQINLEVEEIIYSLVDEKLKGRTGRTLDSLIEERVTLSLSKDFQWLSMDSSAIHGKVDGSEYQVQEYTFERNADQVDTLIVINPDQPSSKNSNTQVKVTVDKISVIKNDALPSKMQILKLSESPLLIVDGVVIEVPIEQLSIIPDDINFIEVLKGENAKKIYGDAAKEGVIIITTKHHKTPKQKSLTFSEKTEQAMSIENARGKNFDFKVYPNPSEGLVQMQLKVEENSKIKLDVFDQSGKLVRSVADGNIDGETLFTWDASSVAKGIYTIILKVDGERLSKQLVIQ
ncbi:MAG: T9SS type A sorting domain-containing protein [Saprospiraceae bacterium]|nr:T9SS type A sorting domain-containing protein [Saprospiraceae bacterium]